MLLAMNAVVAVSAHASEVVTIPASAALPTDGDPSVCVPEPLFGFWGPPGGQCYLDFPLSIPAGRTIQQVAIVHATDSMNPQSPFVLAYVGGVKYSTPTQQIQKFLWSSLDYVPDGTYDVHRLMGQVLSPKGGFVYPDSFVVAADTAYHVFVQIENTGLVGIQVTYN